MAAARVYKKGEDVRSFILSNIAKHPSDIAVVAAQEFGTTRQAVGKHIKGLIEQGALVNNGTQRKPLYALSATHSTKHLVKLEGLQEDRVWQSLGHFFQGLPDNVLAILQHAFTEMLNNAIDHSESEFAEFFITRTPEETTIQLWDHGIGVFEKIQRDLGLLDERHAVLELTKGKLTTAPSKHSGEGIFFTSRLVDFFNLSSGTVSLIHTIESDWDLIIQEEDFIKLGTTVIFSVKNNTSRTTKSVFDKFTDTSEDFGFNKTIVPVRLAQYGNDALVSRSQAKRLLARVDRFKIVVLNFEGIERIGQAFADEVFRVFALQHPEITLLADRASPDVEVMIKRALVAKEHG